MFEIFSYSKFDREYKKLFAAIQTQAKITITDLKIDPFASHLKTHKLQGKFQGFYSCSVNHSYRIIFEVEEKNIYLYSVGDHSMYNH